MGSLSNDNEPNTPTSSTESQQKSSSVSVENIENRDDSSKILSPSSSTSSSSSSSSSPDSPLLDDPFGDNDLFTPSIVSSHVDTPVSENSKETSSIQSAPPNASAASVKEAPPTQTMESNPKTSKYRIPSHVFAKSTTPTDNNWSVASNESLFSIHTGNMSFTNDHMFWKSGELRAAGAGDQASTSGQMFSYSAAPSAAGNSGADTRSRELGIAEATMKEVIRDCENQKNEKSLVEATESRCVSHRSEGSRTSTKSFAFWTGTGDREKDASTHSAGSLKSKSQEQSRPHSQQLAATTEEPLPRDVATRPRWFPCVPCWPFR